MQTQPVGNVSIVARNSFWYGLEMAFGLLAAFITSIAIVRIFGAERLAEFNFVAWLTNITVTVGNVGLPVTTRKYMSEHLARGETEIARALYFFTMKLQTWIAVGITVLAMVLVFVWGNPEYRVISVILVLGMAPRMVSCIPSQANVASEVMRRNTTPSLIGGLVSTVLTVLSLVAGWGLTGVAFAMSSAAWLEFALKLQSVEQWLGGVKPAAITPDLKRRMLSFSSQGVALLLLNIVVWDRSDIFLLRRLNNDPAQITFFYVAFNLVERILMIPKAFGGSLGVTVMAQYGRSQSRLQELTVHGARYALVATLPLLLGMACISRPLVLLLYGGANRPLIPVLSVVAMFGLSKALMRMPTSLLQAAEKQGFLIFWGCFCGGIDILLDVLLIPRYGAVGAAYANGIAQTLAAIGIWWFAARTMHLDVRIKDFGRVAVAGAAMAAGVLFANRLVGGYTGMALSIAVGAAIWIIALRVVRIFDTADAQRFLAVGRNLPASFRPFWKRLIAWVAPPSNDGLAMLTANGTDGT
jgi:O-antigen/teichoic acid export membrane protein